QPRPSTRRGRVEAALQGATGRGGPLLGVPCRPGGHSLSGQAPGAGGVPMSSPASGPILIVEDDADIREAVQGLLEMNGFQVLAASHGREALKHLQGTPRPALILLDMAMPVMGGHRVLTFRKETDGLQEVPVVIISAGMSAMGARDR